MAESTLSEETRIPLKFALCLGGVALAGVLAFLNLKGDVGTMRGDVSTLQQRADRNDVTDAASVANRQEHTLQIQELRITLGTMSQTLKDVRDDLRDVKRVTVPAEGTVRAGGRAR